LKELLRALGRRLGGALERLFELFPLTPLGLLVVFAASMGLVFVAMPEMDLVLVALSWVVLAIAGGAMLAVIVGAVRLGLALRGASASGDERTLETLRSLPTGFSLPGLFFLPFVQVFWEWVGPTAQLELNREGLLVAEDALLYERGHIGSIERRVVVRDVFGLAKVAFRHRTVQPLTVLPSAGLLKQMPILVSMSGGDDLPHPMGVEDGDRVELRRYAPGDPARFIHWKVYGRTRKLVVRKPERALTRARRVVSYLVAGPGDEASAGAARVAIERVLSSGELGVEWIFGADGSHGEARDVPGALDRVVRSAHVRAGAEGGAAGLSTFVARAEERGPASLVLFVPAEPGPWLERAVAVLRPRAARAKVVIGVDGVELRPPRALWARALLREPAPVRVSSAEALEEVVQRLQGHCAEIVVVDRSSGRRLGDAHRRAMLAEASRGAPPRTERAA
jgi:hypothetical protein